MPLYDGEDVGAAWQRHSQEWQRSILPRVQNSCTEALLLYRWRKSCVLVWRGVQTKFAVRCIQGCLHRFLIDYEGNVAFRRALGDGDQIYIFAPQRIEGSAGNSGSSDRKSTRLNSSHT